MAKTKSRELVGGGAKGGSGKMFGRQYACPMPAGQTGKGEGHDDGMWAKGGNTRMHGKQSADAVKAGQTGK